MRVGDALRYAGGSRRVEDVSNLFAVGVRCAIAAFGCPSLPKTSLAAMTGQRLAAIVRPSSSTLRGQQRRRIEVVDHPAQDRGWQSVIEWRVRQARLENAERPHDGFVALRAQQGDRSAIRPHSPGSRSAARWLCSVAHR